MKKPRVTISSSGDALLLAEAMARLRPERSLAVILGAVVKELADEYLEHLDTLRRGSSGGGGPVAQRSSTSGAMEPWSHVSKEPQSHRATGPLLSPSTENHSKPANGAASGTDGATRALVGSVPDRIGSDRRIDPDRSDPIRVGGPEKRPEPEPPTAPPAEDSDADRGRTRAELGRLEPIGAKFNRGDVRDFERWPPDILAAGVDETLERAADPEQPKLKSPVAYLRSVLVDDFGEPPKGTRGTAWAAGRSPIGGIADRVQARRARLSAGRRGDLEPAAAKTPTVNGGSQPERTQV